MSDADEKSKFKYNPSDWTGRFQPKPPVAPAPRPEITLDPRYANAEFHMYPGGKNYPEGIQMPVYNPETGLYESKDLFCDREEYLKHYRLHFKVRNEDPFADAAESMVPPRKPILRPLSTYNKEIFEAGPYNLIHNYGFLITRDDYPNVKVTSDAAKANAVAKIHRDDVKGRKAYIDNHSYSEPMVDDRRRMNFYVSPTADIYCPGDVIGFSMSPDKQVFGKIIWAQMPYIRSEKPEDIKESTRFRMAKAGLLVEHWMPFNRMKPGTSLGDVIIIPYEKPIPLAELLDKDPLFNEPTKVFVRELIKYMARKPHAFDAHLAPHPNLNQSASTLIGAHLPETRHVQMPS